jgi:cytidylate kinase
MDGRSVQVVCISRTLGAGGETIGRAVAERLRFRYVDEEIIAAAADKARVDPTLIADVEHRQSFLNRLMQSLSVVPRAKSQAASEFDLQGAGPPGSARAEYRAVIREAIAEIAAGGRAVIVAHAASMMLAGSQGVLRVLVTASPTKRAERLKLADQPRKKRRRAVDVIEESDRERREYLREFYNIADELPTHYDLVINTDMLTPEQAVTAVVSVASSMNVKNRQPGGDQ